VDYNADNIKVIKNDRITKNSHQNFHILSIIVIKVTPKKTSSKKQNKSDKIKNLFLILAGTAIVIFALVNIFHLVNNDEFTPVHPDDSGSLPIFIQDGKQSNPSQGDEALTFIPDRLIIPAIYLDTPVEPIYAKIIEVEGEEYTQYVAPDKFAAGWHVNSAMLGQTGNTVLSGHHNAFGEVFADLDKLEMGNQIRVMSDNTVFEYIITNTMILPEKDQPLEVRLDNARWIMTSDDERITLVTCWPHNSNTHRLIIVAVPFTAPSGTQVYQEFAPATTVPTAIKPSLPVYKMPTAFYQQQASTGIPSISSLMRQTLTPTISP